MRTIGYECPMCGAIFLLKARLDAHKEDEIPAFRATQAAKNQDAEADWLRRQREIGRIDAEGQWTRDWRPGISDR